MSKKKKLGITIAIFVLVLVIIFMMIDYYFILTKWSAINYGEQLLIEKYEKPYGRDQWSENIPLEAEKKDGIWRVYNIIWFPDGSDYVETYYAIFTKRNHVIEVGMNE